MCPCLLRLSFLCNWMEESSKWRQLVRSWDSYLELVCEQMQTTELRKQQDWVQPICVYKYINKNTFQWDTYRPLVDVSQHALGSGMCIPACTGQGGVSAWGVWGVCLGCMADIPPLWTDRHLWKHNLRKLRLRAVKRSAGVTLEMNLRNPLPGGEEACNRVIHNGFETQGISDQKPKLGYLWTDVAYFFKK